MREGIREGLPSGVLRTLCATHAVRREPCHTPVKLRGHSLVFKMLLCGESSWLRVGRHRYKTLRSHLRVGGTWLQLAYPINRMGPEMDFHHFGQMTDGERTPWAEWMDSGKILKMHKPGKFVVNWCGIVNKDEFVWLELIYLGEALA